MDVLIVLGSDSDLPVGKETVRLFKKLGIAHELRIASAHRTPEKVKSLITEAEASGAKIFIAGAGLSAHLAGVIASYTLKPVIGIPMDGGSLNGMDALLSTVNMPGGVPVAAVSLGKAGGKNAALLAARILALSDDGLAAKLGELRDEMKASVEAADEGVSEKLKNI